MKRCIIKELVSGDRLLSVGNKLHLLRPVVSGQEGAAQQAVKFEKQTLIQTHNFDTNVRFDLNEKKDALLVIDDTIKALKQYSLASVASAQLDLNAQTWLKKKLTDLSAVNAELREKHVEGALVSDRVGEVKFISLDKLAQDGLKPQPDINGLPSDENDKEDEVAKTLFGQQQETLALGLSADGKTLIAIDTLNRVRISEFPNVFSIRHMILQHKNRITDFTFFGQSKLATYSAVDNHLVVSDIHSGSIDYSTKDAFSAPDAVVEGLTGHHATGRLCLLTSNQTSKDYSVLAFSEDLKHTEVLVDALKVTQDDKVVKYMLADSKLVRVGDDTIEVASL